MIEVSLSTGLMETLSEGDGALLRAINFAGSEGWSAFWWLYTDKLSWTVVAAVTVWALLRHCTWRQSLLLVCAVGVLFILSDFAIASTLKPLVGRLRPSHTPGLMEQLDFYNDYRGGRYGFPSNHASNGFAVATLLTLLFRQRLLTATAFLWAAGSCYSRLYLGVHYPTDILVGSLLGVAIGLFVYWGYRRVYDVGVKRGHISGDFDAQFGRREGLWIVAAVWATVVFLMRN